MRSDKKKREGGDFACQVMLKFLADPEKMSWAKAQTLTIDDVQKLEHIRYAIVHVATEGRTLVSADGYCAKIEALVDELEKLPVQCFVVSMDKATYHELRNAVYGEPSSNTAGDDMSPVEKMKTMHGTFLGTLVDPDRVPAERAKELTTEDVAVIRAARKKSLHLLHRRHVINDGTNQMSEEEYIAMSQAQLELVLAFPWTYFQTNDKETIDSYRLSMRKMFALDKEKK